MSLILWPTYHDDDVEFPTFSHPWVSMQCLSIFFFFWRYSLFWNIQRSMCVCMCVCVCELAWIYFSGHKQNFSASKFEFWMCQEHHHSFDHVVFVQQHIQHILISYTHIMILVRELNLICFFFSLYFTFYIRFMNA